MIAYIKKHIVIILLSVLLCCSFLINISAVSVDTEYKYDEIIVEKVVRDYDLEDQELIIYYNEIFEHYFSDTVSSQDESIPEYVLIYLNTNMGLSMPSADVFDDYILKNTSIGYPFAYGYGLYIPSTEKVYDLSYAYNKLDIKGIEAVFTEANIGELIGDMDKDRKITVRDATYIQKCIVGILEYDKFDYIDAFEYQEKPPLLYVSDFNRDCERNIKDATAIQKYIAGIA